MNLMFTSRSAPPNYAFFALFVFKAPAAVLARPSAKKTVQF
jgi:hypothetical protein